MKYILSVLFITTMISAYSANAMDYNSIDPLVEARAIWMDAGAIPKTEAEIRKIIKKYADLNINIILPEVVARGYTVYPSKLIDRDPRFEGAIDPLAVIIDEAHKHGIEVHAWVWVFRAGYTKDRGAILKKHPEWVEINKFGEDLSANGGLWICPAIPEARKFLINLFSEIVMKYDVDGLHLDYIRYEIQSPTPYGYNEYTRNLFKKQYGIDPLNIDRLSYNQIHWNRFRERQINTFVQSVSQEIRSLKPGIIISAAVGSDINVARLNLMQNWQNWVDNKWIDFITPMTYMNNTEKFRSLVASQEETINSKAILVPGIGLHTHRDRADITANQIAITRMLNTEGQALFSSSHLQDSHQQMLKKIYINPALIPFRKTFENAHILYCKAKELNIEGKNDIAEWFNKRAENLSAYANYKATFIPYIHPSETPLKIPNSILPIPKIEIPKTSSAIVIDGNLSDNEWTNAAKVQLAYTPDGESASVPTTAYLLYDDNQLYIAFNCNEPNMEKIKATIDKRDGPTFYDDSVEVFIDPTSTGQTYYHLSTNTLGTQFDQKVLNPAWNAKWETKSTLSSDYWSSEIAIPFAEIGIEKPEPGKQISLNLTRNRPTEDSVQYFTWSVLYGGFHSPDRFGSIVLK